MEVQFFIIFMLINIVVSSDFKLEVDPTESYSEVVGKNDEVNRLTLIEGSSATLKCSDTYDDFNSTGISWTFLKCRFGECSGRGHPICNNNCKLRLHLDKVKFNDGGLYSCYQTSPPIQGYTLEAHLIISYHVSIIKGEIKSEPLFLEVPQQTVKVMSQTKLSLYCRIMSLVPAIVKWFKQIPNSKIKFEPKNPTSIIYQNKTYQPLDWYSFVKRGNEYSGKLVIDKTKLNDGGNYVCCIVTSQFGIQIRESKVIITPYIPESGTKEGEIKFEWSQSEKIWTAAVLSVVVMVICGWTLACCCGRTKTASDRSARTNRNTRRRRDPPPMTTDTSDYEQV